MGTHNTSGSRTEGNKESTKMSTSLLRLGRLEHFKVLQREGWGLLKSSSAAPLCTKAQGPTKAIKKAKAPTLEFSEERAVLLAYKTAVAFPLKPLSSGLSSVQAPVNVEPVASPVTAETILTARDVDPAPVTASNAEAVSAETGVTVEIDSPALDMAAPAVEAAKSASSTAAEAVASTTIPVEAFEAKSPSVAVTQPAPVTDVAASIVDSATPVIDPAPPVAEPDLAASVTEGIPLTASAGPPEKAASASADPGDHSSDSSSSSSDSDSESDSDSDDEKSEVSSKATPEAVETKTVSRSSKAGRADGAAAPTSVTLDGTAEALPEVTPAASLDTVLKATKEEAPVAAAEVSTEAVIVQVSTEPIPVKVATGAPVDVVALEDPPEFEAGAGPAQAVTEGAPVEGAPVEGAPVEGAPVEGAPVEGAPVEGAPVEGAPVEGAPVEAAPEELLDSAPVMAEAAGEELITQPPAEAEHMEASEEAVVEPPAPEPFDNTTYKNLQHHQYHHYTFADLDLEMAKYRLPQPSSGRPSPRH